MEAAICGEVQGGYGERESVCVNERECILWPMAYSLMHWHALGYLIVLSSYRRQKKGKDAKNRKRRPGGTKKKGGRRRGSLQRDQTRLNMRARGLSCGPLWLQLSL